MYLNLVFCLVLDMMLWWQYLTREWASLTSVHFFYCTFQAAKRSDPYRGGVREWWRGCYNLLLNLPQTPSPQFLLHDVNSDIVTPNTPQTNNRIWVKFPNSMCVGTFPSPIIGTKSLTKSLISPSVRCLYKDISAKNISTKVQIYPLMLEFTFQRPATIFQFLYQHNSIFNIDSLPEQITVVSQFYL